MSDLSQPDSSMDHLFPAFREQLTRLLEAVQHSTGHEWRMEEGYRSQARQDWLYAQGRTRPGKIVTWTQHSSWHSLGLAADCYPVRDSQLWYAAPRALYLLWRSDYLSRGFQNPAWEEGDLGHVQWGSDVIRHQAAGWIERGFK